VAVLAIGIETPTRLFETAQTSPLTAP